MTGFRAQSPDVLVVKRDAISVRDWQRGVGIGRDVDGGVRDENSFLSRCEPSGGRKCV